MKEKETSRLSVFLVVLAVCLVYALGGGIRSNYGLMRGAMAASSGVDYAGISFVLAAAQLAFGIMQPVFGAVALKTSNVFVLLCGAAMAVVGLVLTPLCHGSWTLLLCFGILMPAGLGAFSFGLIMGAVTPLLGEKRASAVSGIINASSGLGSILLALVLRGVLDRFGLWGAVIALCLPMLCLMPVLLLLRKADAKQAESTPPLLRPLLRSAFHDRSYRLLALAFFTCGFHMAIIETHLYTQFTSYGFTEQSVTYAFSIYGIATMAGSVVSGYLGSRIPMKTVLGCFYASRTLWIVGFLLLPKSPASMYLFAIMLGFTGMATVPPTSGLIGRLFGPAALGTLFGVAFLFHQVGSFVSAWIGGLAVTATGGYTLIWGIDAALCVAAAVFAFRVRLPAPIKNTLFAE